MLKVIADYTYALDTLDRYDYQRLAIDKTTTKTPFRATYENATAAIDVLREKFVVRKWDSAVRLGSERNPCVADREGKT
ncbi:MAG: hypothetical protein LBM67_03250 [Lentimicrobiaceae bacterium]|nr:hypothetical protein [Lentimicrobiaceae bacterium]